MKCPHCEASIQPQRARRPAFAAVVAAVPATVGVATLAVAGAEAAGIAAILVVAGAGLGVLVYFSSPSGARTEYRCPQCRAVFSI